MFAFVSRAHLCDRQVKSYYTKGYFDKFRPVHKGTALSKQQPTTGAKRVGRVRSLTSTTTKAGQLLSLLSRFRSRYAEDSRARVGRRSGCVTTTAITTTTLVLTLSSDKVS